MMKLFSLKEQQQNRAATGQGAGDKGQTAAHLRLQKDMADLSLPAQCKVELDEADPLNFRLFVSPDEGFYLGGRFHFSFAVPRAYPHEPPKVKCLTKVYHPNIDLDGNVCLNILREEWKPILTITGVIFGLLFLFVEPNPEDPLNKDAAHTLTHNKRAFEQNVHKSPAQTNLSPSAHSSSSSVPMFSKPDSYFHSTHLVEMRPRPCKEVASEYARFLRESDRASRMSRLAELLSNLSEFRIHTGNINQWAALKQKRFENSSEELTECLKMQLESWVPSEAQLKESEEGSVTLCENRECGPCTLTDIGERDNLAVTLKIFLSGVCPVQARRCLDSVLQELQTGRVEKLIVALSLEAEGSSEAEEAVAWVESFWPLWESLCGLVAEGKVRELGVADLELDFLSALVDKADRLGALRPAIDHYNLQSCCSVPDELQAYAKEKGIKLLTHNDPKPFCTDNRLEEICCTYLNMPVCPLPGAVKWVARYAVMIVSRSIMTAKGFVVDFGNCDKSIGRP